MLRRRAVLPGLCLVLALVLAALADPLGAGARTRAATVPPCGAATVFRPDGTPWQCTFDDEFNDNSVDPTKWTVEQTAAYGYHSGPECFVDSTRNVSEAFGVLRLTARRESAPFTCSSPLGDYTTRYTAGMVLSAGHFSQTYGRFEVRAKLPAQTMAGLQETFWLWPDDSRHYGSTWPASGEIDFAEFYSLYPNQVVPYVHYVASSPDPNITNTGCRLGDASQFHTYTLVWTPTTLTIGYDGTTCLVDDWTPVSTMPSTAPFDQPFFLNLTQALGIGRNAFDPATTALPATTSIDYVRVWR